MNELINFFIYRQEELIKSRIRETIGRDLSGEEIIQRMKSEKYGNSFEVFYLDDKPIIEFHNPKIQHGYINGSYKVNCSMEYKIINKTVSCSQKLATEEI